MSRRAIRQALETALNAVSPSIAYAWENAPYTPTVGTPFGAVFLMAVEPDNPEIGTSYTENGQLQVNLNYPLDTGASAAETQAEAIRAAFPRGLALTASGVTVHITKTPEIGTGRTDDGWFFLPVRVRFHAHIRVSA